MTENTRATDLPISIYTIGFRKKSARDFFTLLTNNSVKRVIDVRLNNTSQLAGFTKMRDLDYFLDKIGDIEYIHLPQLAPTQEIRDDYEKKKGSWSAYEERFLKLMKARKIEKTLSRKILDNSCLLCSEPTPEKCHRRLVAEYLKQKLKNININHI